MASWLQRLITVIAGVGVGAAGVFIPPLAPIAVPAAVGIIAWAIPHPADKPLP